MNWWIYGVTPQKFFDDESSSWKINKKFEKILCAFDKESVSIAKVFDVDKF